MSKKIYQIYEIGQEKPLEDESIEVDLTRNKSKSKIVWEIPQGLTKVQEETWKLQNKKK